MPVQCTYGTRVKATSPAIVWVLWTAFRAFVSLSLSRLGSILFGYFSDFPVTLDTFCASEPTVRDPPTVLQWIGAFGLDFEAKTYVAGYLNDLFLADLWGQYCECVPSTGAGSTCSLIAVPWTTLTNLGDPGSNRNAGLTFTALGTGRVVYGADVYLNAGATLVRIILWDSTTTTILRQKNSTPGVTGRVRILFDSPYTMANGESNTIAFEHDGTQVYYSWGANAAPPTDAEVSYSTYHENSDYSVCPTAGRTYKAPLMPLVCNGGPPAGTPIPYTPPVVTDPTEIPNRTDTTCTTTADVCTELRVIEAAIRASITEVRWIQSAVAPTCWIPGTPVTGLAGAGTLAVTDVVGAYVQVTVPATWGRTAETPPRYIPKVGEVQFAVDGVVADGRQLHYAAEQLLGCPIATNSIVYNIRAGVTATITPLLRCK